jgi:hypothetical protein
MRAVQAIAHDRVLILELKQGMLLASFLSGLSTPKNNKEARFPVGFWKKHQSG